MKKVSFWAGAVFLVLLLASCDEVTGSQNAYNFGIHTFNGSSTAQMQVENYLKNLGIPWGTKFYTGTDTADTDKQARSDFTAAIAKIDEGKLGSIAVNSSNRSLSFTYAVYASGNDKDPLDSYTYILLW
jgi:hypothetical protein